MLPLRRLLATLLPLAVLTVALLAAAPAGAASPAASAAARCRGTIAVVNDKPACLKVGQRCKRRFRKDYLGAGYVCHRTVRRVRHHRRRSYRLRPASLAKRRQGEAIALPATARPTYKQSLWLFDKAIGSLPGVKTPRGAV